MVDGWEGIDEIGKPAANLPEETDAELVDKLFVAVFTTPAGQQLLRHWKRTYLDRPVCVPGVGAEVGFHREGQNSVVREAIQRLIRGTTPKPKT